MADPYEAVDALCGVVPDAAADRAVEVLHAHAAALAWVRQALGTYPAPPGVAQQLAVAAAQLRDPAE
jgi:hypothetical protein